MAIYYPSSVFLLKIYNQSNISEAFDTDAMATRTCILDTFF